MLMMLIDDFGVLLRMARGQPSSGSHAENLQAFYAPQATRYDSFREDMLHGRAELVSRLDIQPGYRMVELGGGTGRNIDFLGERLQSLASYELVDLCPALLDVARTRTASQPMVKLVQADAASWRPAEPVDIVLMSYSLTMMPDWTATLRNALLMLRPGGQIAVVDFHIPSGMNRMHAQFWRRWFSHDGVRLSDLHLRGLRVRTRETYSAEERGRLPYLTAMSSMLHVPYYLYLGRRS
jgi:S-adenosylmethionine-diacylgycerolhomoserine-N-methlytransferase